MRTYEPIWEELKKKGYCEVITDKQLVPRLRKAVIKEKYMDEKYKETHEAFLYVSVQNFHPLEDKVIFQLKSLPKFIKQENTYGLD